MGCAFGADGTVRGGGGAGGGFPFWPGISCAGVYGGAGLVRLPERRWASEAADRARFRLRAFALAAFGVRRGGGVCAQACAGRSAQRRLFGRDPAGADSFHWVSAVWGAEDRAAAARDGFLAAAGWIYCGCSGACRAGDRSWIPSAAARAQGGCAHNGWSARRDLFIDRFAGRDFIPVADSESADAAIRGNDEHARNSIGDLWLRSSR